MAFLSALIVLVLVPEVKSELLSSSANPCRLLTCSCDVIGDHMKIEDAIFKEYLVENGYDV